MKHKQLLGIGITALFCALPLAAQDRPQNEQPQPEETLDPLIIPQTEIEGVETEEVVIPEINIPEVRIPEIRIPKITVPNITIPEIRISQEQLEMMDDDDREELQRDMEELRQDLVEQREEIRVETRRQREQARQEMNIQRDELRRNIDKLRKEVEERRRELERMREKTNQDSAGMRDALNEAQKALEMAQTELENVEAARKEMKKTFTLSFAGTEGAFAVTPNGELSAGAFAPMAKGGTWSVANGDSSLHTYFFSSGDGTAPKANCQVFMRRFASGDSTVTLGAFPSVPDISSMAHAITVAPNGHSGTVMINGDTVMILNDENEITTDDNGTQKRVRVFVKNDKGEGTTRTRVIIVDGYNEIKTDTESPNAPRDVVVEKRIIRNAPDGNSDADAGYSLSENRPNPFDNSTTINFKLGRDGHALLTVFDATGKVVRTLVDEDMSAGEHSVKFDAGDLPNGLYLYRLASGGYTETRTMTLQK